MQLVLLFLSLMTFQLSSHMSLAGNSPKESRESAVKKMFRNADRAATVEDLSNIETCYDVDGDTINQWNYSFKEEVFDHGALFGKEVKTSLFISGKMSIDIYLFSSDDYKTQKRKRTLMISGKKPEFNSTARIRYGKNGEPFVFMLLTNTDLAGYDEHHSPIYRTTRNTIYCSLKEL